MRRRCNDPEDKSYKWYGQKGVRVCPEWNDDFATFRKWAHPHGYRQGLVIDRIDPDEDYAPTNCQWITAEENRKRAHP